MTNKEWSEKYPKCFMERDGKCVWIKVIPDDTSDGNDVTRAELDRVYQRLSDNGWSSVGSWSGERSSSDNYRLGEVQALLNYAIRARWALDMMMKKSIERGAAYYHGETGKFTWKEKESK